MVDTDSGGVSYMDWDTVFNVGMVVACITCAGLAAGLTMGLLSLEKRSLEVKTMIAHPEEAAAASAVLPIIQKHHLLLVTLLLCNAIANEALPIFLEELVPNYVAVILSVTLVLICGEIIPSALFTGPNQLMIVASLKRVVNFLMYVMYPVAFPISKVLDWAFGEEEEEFISRNEFEALMILQSPSHKNEFAQGSLCRIESDSSPDCDSAAPPRRAPHKLSRDEVGIMTGVLRLSQLTAGDAMIRIKDVCMISSDMTLDERCLQLIQEQGYSRIPVFNEKNRKFIMGILLVKELIVVNPSLKRPLVSLPLREPVVIHPDEDLLEVLNIFQEGKSHMALVSADPETTLRCIQQKTPPTTHEAEVLGIITLENVLEKIIQEEIYDEMDTNATSRRSRKSIKVISRASLAEPHLHRIVPHTLRRSASGKIPKKDGETTPLVDKTTSGYGTRPRRDSKSALPVQLNLKTNERKIRIRHYKSDVIDTANMEKKKVEDIVPYYDDSFV